MATNGMQIRKKPKILLSSFDLDERKELSDKIRSIGGILYESSNYTSCASHIICKLPSRGEKFICACAEGKWVLTRSYVDESFAKRQWLEEDAFEWTSEKANAEPPHHLFTLPRRWRLRQQSGKKRIFHGWLVLLVFSNQKKKEGFKRLVEAGGGRVSTLKPPYRSFDKKQLKCVVAENINAKELKAFTRAGVPILPCERIPEFIIKESVDGSDLIKPSLEEQSNGPQKNRNSVLTTRSESNSLKRKMPPVKQSGATPTKQTVLKNFFVNLKTHNINGSPKSGTGSSKSGTVSLKLGTGSPMPETGSPKSENSILSHKIAITDKEDTSLYFSPNPSTLKGKSSPICLEKQSENENLAGHVKESSKCCSANSPNPSVILLESKPCNISPSAMIEASNEKKSKKSIEVINLEEEDENSKENHCSKPQINAKSPNDSAKLVPLQNVASKLKRFSYNEEKISEDDVKSTTGKKDVTEFVKDNDKLEQPSNSKSNERLTETKIESQKSCAIIQDKNIDNQENIIDSEKTTIKNASSSSTKTGEMAIKRRRSERGRIPKKSFDLIDIVVLDSPVPLTRNAKKKRSLNQSLNANVASESDVSPKKTKLDVESEHHNRESTTYDLHLHTIFPWTAQQPETETVRYSLHRNGIDFIEGRLEDGHKNIAVKMMSSYLSQSCYLAPSLLYVLMQMLKDPDDSFGIANVTEISSLLNRYLSFHPPHQLRGVYLSALHKPVAGENGDIVETSDPFTFLMETISEAKDLLMEKNDADNKTNETILKDQIRRECKMALLKFMIAVYEMDFLSFTEKTSLKGKCRPLLMQMLWPKSDSIGGGVILKDFLKMAMEITLCSLKDKCLAPIKSAVFTLLQIAAGCCQLSDVCSLNNNYGPACTSLVTELFVFTEPLIKDANNGHNVMRSIFAAIHTRWLAARLSDHIIGLYDASSLNGVRHLLSQPLSLDKVISCYFRLIPKYQDCPEATPKRENRKRPLAVIGDSASESSRLNSNSVKNGETLNAKRNIKGETKLHVACIKNQPSVVKQLLCEGINPNLTDNAGWTALHEASINGNRECVAELLKCKDVNIFATAMNGVTALHDAVANNHFDVVKMLLNAGGSKLLDMRTSLDKSTSEHATTNEMKSLLGNIGEFENESGLRLNHKKHHCSQDEIQSYVLLLSVLLRYFTKTSQKNDSCKKMEKLKELQKHILSLNAKLSSRNRFLMGSLKMYLS